MADFKLDNDVRDVLSREGGLTQAFIFPSSATEKLSAMLGTGVSIDEKKRDQSFFTPTPLALKVATIAEVTGYDVLEPSAGRGALALACMDSGANGVECFENNREYVDELLSQGFPVTHGDFLRFHPAGRRYERIVMNPPFTKNQDVKHVRHAMLWLKPSGFAFRCCGINVKNFQPTGVVVNGETVCVVRQRRSNRLKYTRTTAEGITGRELHVALATLSSVVTNQREKRTAKRMANRNGG